MRMNIDDPTSYETESHLASALERAGLSGLKHLVVCNREGEFTAVFPTGWNPDTNPGSIAQAGFMVVG